MQENLHDSKACRHPGFLWMNFWWKKMSGVSFLRLNCLGQLLCWHVLCAQVAMAILPVVVWPPPVYGSVTDVCYPAVSGILQWQHRAVKVMRRELPPWIRWVFCPRFKKKKKKKPFLSGMGKWFPWHLVEYHIQFVGFVFEVVRNCRSIFQDVHPGWILSCHLENPEFCFQEDLSFDVNGPGAEDVKVGWRAKLFGPGQIRASSWLRGGRSISLAGNLRHEIFIKIPCDENKTKKKPLIKVMQWSARFCFYVCVFHMAGWLGWSGILWSGSTGEFLFDVSVVFWIALVSKMSFRNYTDVIVLKKIFSCFDHLRI